MSSRTLLVLLLAVAALGALAVWQSGREEEAAADLEVALFPGVAAADVRALRVENVERDWLARIERRADGGWRMTDPVEVPAEASRVEHALSTMLGRTGAAVEGPEADPARAGLAPPRLVVELEVGEGAAARRERLEIGALDLDGQRVHVRSRGRVLRAWRDVDTALARSLEDFKAERPLEVDPRSIVEIHRSGTLPAGDGAAPLDLALDALADAGAWRATSPFEAALDPLGVSLYLQGCAQLVAHLYVDYGTTPPALYGLDPPEVRIALVALDGRRTTIDLGRPEHAPGAAWYAREAGQGPVWTLEGQALELLLVPSLDLADHRVVRYARADVRGLMLAAEGREVSLARDGLLWRMRARQLGRPDWEPERLADPGRVERLLGELERFELAGFVPGRAIGDAERAGAVWVELDGVRQGGVIGPRETRAGREVVLFQREGDSLAAIADPLLADLARTSAEDLASLDLSVVQELDQQRLVVEGLGVRREYARGRRGLWTTPGVEVEARELHPVLDPLFFLRAERHVGTSTDLATLEQPITVQFEDVGGNRVGFVIGIARDAEGEPRAAIDLAGRRSLLADRALHEKLAKVLRGG